MNRPQVVVRFAPSPTGYLHIGGARTAIFNWLFARKSGGKFILRIEDTDAERSTESAIQGILDGMTWLGLQWDEGPDFQSRHIREHVAAAEKLLDSGHAYKCFCTKESLEAKREAARSRKESLLYDGTCRNLSHEKIAEKEAQGIPYTLRLKVPRDEGGISFQDSVYGNVEKKHKDLEDFVILRSNGQPLYVLSNAVDDIRDGITHVIRGQDHLANTPKQILIYRALGKPIPQFAHMSLTLDPRKAKISKRHHGEQVAVHYYRDLGFLPSAFVNFLVLLGWSESDSREIYTREELIEAFSLEGISRANAVFDIQGDGSKFVTDPKALSINAHYLKTLPVETIEPYVVKQLREADIWDPDFAEKRREWFLSTIDLIRSRFTLTTDFVTLGRAYFTDTFAPDPGDLGKNILAHPELKEWFPLLADRLEKTEPFIDKTAETVIREVLKDSGIKAGILVNGIRTAITGHGVGPEFLSVLTAIGVQKVAERLKRAAVLIP